jgi:uncharacterized protein
MQTADILMNMIAASDGNLHDINHFLKVYAYARTIAEKEGLDETLRQITEIAAIVHDIACPLCRAKYGNTNGKYQELEGMPLARDFLSGCGLPAEVVERVVYLVGHHHSPQMVDGPDFQILLEADYLVNADESAYSPANREAAAAQLFRTPTGLALLRSIYGAAS